MSPKTLADVKAGDEVTLFPRKHLLPYLRLTVDRVTKTLIIVGDRKFGRDDGFASSYQFIGRIAVGAAALAKEAERDANIIRQEVTRKWRSATRCDYLSREEIIRVRAACDVAEAALRELGKWEDEP